MSKNTTPTRDLLFIDLIDTTGRKSHLSAYGRQGDGTLTVAGNLEHGAKIRPAEHADAIALIRWTREAFGMADPAAEIAALREALTAVYEDWRTLSGIDHGAGDEYEDVRNIDAKARAALGGAK